MPATLHGWHAADHHFSRSADWLFALARIPHVELLSRHDPARAAEEHGEKTAEYFPPGIHSQFASGSNGRFAQELESAQPFQGDGEKYFFACEIDFIETASREKSLARGEEKSAGTKIESEVKHAENMEHCFAPWWNFTIEHETAASAGKIVFERIYRTPNMCGPNLSIGIDENKDIAACCSGAGITRGCDLAALD